MKSAIKFARAMAVVGAALAVTACGGEELTSEELASLEAEALATSEAELGSCAGWSQWISSGQTTCEYRSCGYTWQCVPGYAHGGDTSVRGEQPDSLIPHCEPGTVLVREYNPATFAQQYSYRACFNEAGTYTHTEYQYQTVFATCGC